MIMKSQKTLFSGLVGLTLLALSACTSDNTAVSANEDTAVIAKIDEQQAGYLKPGAAIEFSHTYDGKTQPGEVENFQIFVKGGNLSRTVEVKMENPDGLQVFSDAADQKLDIAEDADGLDHTMNVSVGAQNPGRYYLKFIATSDQGGEAPMMRAFAIAIQVGDQPYVPELGKGMTAEETPTGEKIITMEATEIIEN